MNILGSMFITMSAEDIMRKSTTSQKCHQSVTKFHQDRWTANLARRWHADYTTYTIYTEAPYYEAIKNGTCVLTPEGISGPYVYLLLRS